MKSITFDQLKEVTDAELRGPKKLSLGDITFSIIHPWSPRAWEVAGYMKEMADAGEDFAMPIAMVQNIVDETSGVEYERCDVSVYKQFVFPEEPDRVFAPNISLNILHWLNTYHQNNLKPATKLMGNLLDVEEEVIPVGAFVVINTFIVDKIEKEISVKDYLDQTTAIKGDVVRILQLEDESVKKLHPAFIYQTTYLENELRLFEVK